MTLKQAFIKFQFFTPARNVPGFLSCVGVRAVRMRRATCLDASPARKPMRQDVPECVDDSVLGLSWHLHEVPGYRGGGECSSKRFARGGEGDFLRLVKMREISCANSVPEEI